jgi:hypothetical protein
MLHPACRLRALGHGCAKLALAALPCLSTAAHAAPQIWFGAVDPVVQRDRHTDQPADYMQLFQPGAPWGVAAAHTAVFKISTQLVLRGAPGELQTVIDGLRARHIALAIELGLLSYSDRCGKGSEGYAAPLAVEVVAKKIRAAGGQLDYVDMDEPVTYGHSKTGRTARGFALCHDPVSALADQTAPKVALLRRYFPNVQIGEIDGLDGRFPEQVDSIMAFIDAMQQRAGVHVAYLHADVAWRSDWRGVLADLTQRAHQRGVRVGDVFDGNIDARSSEEWIAEAIQHFRQAVSYPATRPDDWVFQSWSQYPTHLLPESDPGAWTYAVRFAVSSMR